MYIHENELLNSSQILKNTEGKLSWRNLHSVCKSHGIMVLLLVLLIYSVDQENKPVLLARCLLPGQLFFQSSVYFLFFFFLKAFKHGWEPRGFSSSILQLKVHSPKVYCTRRVMRIHLCEEHVRRHLVMSVPIGMTHILVPLQHQTCLWEDRGCLHFVYAMDARDITCQGRG